MLLSSDHPLNSGETAGANSASIPVEYYFSMHWFNYAWENWKQLQEEVAFFPRFDHLSFRYAKRLYHPLAEVKNSAWSKNLRGELYLAFY